MKNTPIKLMSVLLLGTSLTACSVLSNIMGSSKDVKFSSYKNEVTTEEFAAGMNESITDNPVLNGTEDPNDFAFSVSLNASSEQKITNSKAAVKDRGSLTVSASASAKLAYDKDNEAAEITGKLSADGKMVTPSYGTQKASSDTELDVVAQQENEAEIKLVNKKEKTYSLEEADVSLGVAMQELKSYLGVGVYYLSSALASMEVEGKSDLKLYKDADLYTIVYSMKEETELSNDEGVYATAIDELNFKAQFDLSKNVKIRFQADASSTINYSKAAQGGYGPLVSIIDLNLPVQRNEGDKEVQKVKLGLSADYSSKSQNIKQVNTGSYTEVEEIINL